MGTELFSLAIVAAALGVVWTRFSRWLATRLEILDHPDPRKVHREAIPYLGGLGLLLAFFSGLCLLPMMRPMAGPLYGAKLEGILWGAVAIFCVGLWDDVCKMRALTKLMLQAAVGAAMWKAGVRVEEITTGLGHKHLLIGSALGPAISMMITVGWYVVLMNSMNLIDGLDGLAGGVGAISALSIVAIALVVGTSDETMLGAIIAALTAGAAIGFLTQNWHPAKIFLGDAGSLLLGFLLATAALTSSTKASTLQAMLVPLVAVGLPVFESVFSFMRRLVQGTSPFKPDRRHLHHRLMDLGLSQRRVVLFLLFATAFLGVNSVLLARAGSMLLLLNVAFLGLGLVILIENLSYLERRRTESQILPMWKASVGATPPSEPPKKAAASTPSERRPE